MGRIAPGVESRRRASPGADRGRPWARAWGGWGGTGLRGEEASGLQCPVWPEGPDGQQLSLLALGARGARPRWVNTRREEAGPEGRGAAGSSPGASTIWGRTRRPWRRTSGPAGRRTTVRWPLLSHLPLPQVPGVWPPVSDHREAPAAGIGECRSGQWAARPAQTGRDRGWAEGWGSTSGGGHCTSGSRGPAPAAGCSPGGGGGASEAAALRGVGAVGGVPPRPGGSLRAPRSFCRRHVDRLAPRLPGS